MKTNLDTLFKTKNDPVLFSLSDETGFYLKRFSKTNPQVKKAMATHFGPYARQLQHGKMDDDKVRDMSIKVFINVCLVDWKGIKIDGVDTPFSEEAALKLFKSLPDLFDTLEEYAVDFKNFKSETEDDNEGVAEDVGNSSPLT